MNTKYELLEPRKDGLRQIRALRDLKYASKGTLGGFVSSESVYAGGLPIDRKTASTTTMVFRPTE